jgi:hypothetical protein
MTLSVPTVISNGLFSLGSISDEFVNEKFVLITLLLAGCIPLFYTSPTI